jgi:hypothetical protein
MSWFHRTQEEQLERGQRLAAAGRLDYNADGSHRSVRETLAAKEAAGTYKSFATIGAEHHAAVIARQDADDGKKGVKANRKADRKAARKGRS